MIITNTSNVTYDYTLPDQSTVSAESTSNPVATENLTDAVSRLKSSSKAYVQENEQAMQTINVTNNSGIKMTDLFLKDFLSEGAQHVDGSVTVNGVSMPLYDMKAGIPLPDLNPTESAVVTYLILSGAITPSALIANDATLNFSVEDPVQGPVSFLQRTNLVTIPVVRNSMSVVKSVDKAYASKGDVLTYTSTVTNNGTLQQTNLVFRDAVPAGTTFVTDSVLIDGVPKPGFNPTTGFPVEDLAPSGSVTVTFKAMVN